MSPDLRAHLAADQLELIDATVEDLVGVVGALIRVKHAGGQVGGFLSSSIAGLRLSIAEVVSEAERLEAGIDRNTWSMRGGR